MAGKTTIVSQMSLHDKSWKWAWWALLFTLSLLPKSINAAPSDFVVYGVYTALNMGFPNEVPKKDFYVNLGLKHGVKIGTTLEVLRKVATYDAIGKKLYKDMLYPIAKIKIIHTEDNASIARLETLSPEDRTPASTPRAILVGDMVRTVQK